jgi:hypothetical protein
MSLYPQYVGEQDTEVTATVDIPKNQHPLNELDNPLDKSLTHNLRGCLFPTGKFPVTVDARVHVQRQGDIRSEEGHHTEIPKN